MPTINSINSNIPIEIAKGGTNATSLTSNGVIYYDGAKLDTVAPGTAGQVLTSNGAGVAPTMQTIAGNSVYLIESKTANNSAELEFKTGITSAYNSYIFEVSNIIPATNNTRLYLQISTDTGTSYINANYSYGNQTQVYDSAVESNLNGTTALILSGEIANATPGISGTLFLFNVADTKKIAAIGYFVRVRLKLTHDFVVGNNSTTDPVDAFKWLFEAGNITSGRITLYGIKES